MPPKPEISAAKAAKHNRSAGAIVQIMASVCTSDENTLNVSEMMVLCESVVMGVFLFHVAMGGDRIVLKTMFEDIEARLASRRLGDVETEGTG